MVFAAKGTDVEAVAFDAVGGDAVPPIAEVPIARCDPFPSIVLHNVGLGVVARGGIMSTSSTEDAKGGGLTGKVSRTVVGVQSEPVRHIVVGGPIS